MQVTIVIPTYNEAENIGELIGRIRVLVPEADILVVDDNSPDGTGKIVQEIAGKDNLLKLLSRDKKEGLGVAYIAGFREVLKTQNDGVIVMMDADLSHDPKYLPLMIDNAKSYDVVLGSRYVAGGATEGWELWRRALSYFGNMYARVIAGLPIFDCTGGFNIISIAKLRQIDFNRMNTSGYAFIMSLKFALYKVGATFKELPITFKNRVEGESKMSARTITSYFKEGILTPWRMRLPGHELFVFILSVVSRLTVLLVLLAFMGQSSLVGFGDGPDYLDLAEGLVSQGQFISQHPGLLEATRVPGYPAIISLSLLFHIPFWLISFVQIICVATIPIICMRLSKFIGLSDKVAFGAGILTALEPLGVFYSVVLIPDALGALMFICATYLLLRFMRDRNYGDIAWSAIIFGFMNYLRPIGTYLYIVIPIFILFYSFVIKKTEFKKYFVGAVCFAALLYMTLMPWMIRNDREFDHFAFSSGVGRQVYEITGAGILSHLSGASYPETQLRMREDVRDILSEPRELGAFSNQDILLERGLEIIKSHPFVYSKLFAKSLLTFFTSGNYQYLLANYHLINYDADYTKAYGIINMLGRLTWMIVVILSIIGGILLWKREPESKAAVALVSIIVLYLAIVVAHITVGVEARHRLFINPFYYIFMMYAIFQIIYYVRARTK